MIVASQSNAIDLSIQWDNTKIVHMVSSYGVWLLLCIKRSGSCRASFFIKAMNMVIASGPFRRSDGLKGTQLGARWSKRVKQRKVTARMSITRIEIPQIIEARISE